MANEKKGKGKTGGSGNVPPAGNGADNDAVSDQSSKVELSTEPKKTTGSKSYSDMLRERTAQRQESMKRFSQDEVDKMKADKQKQIDDQTIIQK